MTGFWTRIVQSFDSATAAIEDETAHIKQDTDRLTRQTAEIRRDIGQIQSETREQFNQAVAEAAALIETLKDPEDRELVRVWALREFQSISLSGGPIDLSKLMAQPVQGESVVPR